MVYCSLKENTYYDSELNVFDYKLVDGKNNVIYFGHSVKNPKTGINRINITEIVRDYLYSNLEDDWPELSNEFWYIVKQRYAYRTFTLINGEISVQVYAFLIDYTDLLTSDELCLNDTINGKLDPRMKFFYSRYGQFESDITITDFVTELVIVFSKEPIFQQSGGTIIIGYTASTLFEVVSVPDWISSIDISGGVVGTITITADENLGDENRTGTILFKRKNSSHSNIVELPVTQRTYYDNVYLTTVALSAGTIGIKVDNEGVAKYYAYRKNGGEWFTGYTSPGISVSVAEGDSIEWKSVGTYTAQDRNVFYSTCPFDLEGNIMSLVYSDNFGGKVDLRTDNVIISRLFSGSSVHSAALLQLPATALTYGCYWNLFSNCTGLTEAPELPATVLAEQCYDFMFEHCTSLATAPALPATTLAPHCYEAMFWGCSSLTTPPELPATTLAGNCYAAMFAHCVSLETAPALPATELTYRCYRSMFWDCTSLTTAPELPALTLAPTCYGSMFEGCISLVIAPALPATTLDTYCYEGMFSGCISIITAPDLLASNVPQKAYSIMFDGCSSLNYVKCLATNFDYMANDYWLRNVAENGTFIKKTGVTWTTGESGIPEWWTVEEVNA